MTAPDIFISYSSDDRARAKLFADAFAAEGLSVWWDAGLRAGDAYDQKIEQALKSAKAVVVLWSKTSVESRWVRAEATLADRARTLVPCMIEPCDRPIMFELTHTAELAHWQGETAEKAWQAFLSDVRRFVAKEAAPAAVMSAAAPPTVAETLKPGQSGSAPSLAVLPFSNRSGLPEDEVFAEGMVEDVISALAQGVNVRVLGATTTANLSRAAITDLAALGRQLGVHYLLEGNVRRVGTSLRVTTQLLEAATGAVMWTGKFDRPLSELAELQEELVTDIAASLDAQVYSIEVERALRKPSDITAWEAVVRSLSAYRQWDASARVDAIEEARRAVTIAPNYAPAHAALAHALANAYLANPDDPAEVQSIRAIAENALALSPDDAVVLSFVGLALCYVGYPEGGERHTMRAVRKAPGSGMLHFFHGGVCIKLNREEEALSHLKTAERLGPGSQLMWVVKYWQSLAYRELEGWVEANAALEESLRQLPSFGMGHVGKAICCLQLGEQDAAREHIETARRLNWGSVQAERLWRINRPNSPRLDADIATMRALYAATETAS